MKHLICLLVIALVLCTSITCKKMEVRPDSSIIMPKTVSDFERLLEHDVITSTPGLPHLGGDEYLLRDYAAWQSLFTNTQKNLYIWEKDIYNGERGIMDWNFPYQGIFYCNSVLDHISVLDDSKDKNRILGWALFSRAYLFHSLATTFAAAYDPITAKDIPGIPLKLKSNIDELEQRSTLEQTYAQIIQDALDAAGLLSNEKPLSSKNHPSKAAAYALLARVYLNLREYSNAELYVDKALGIYDELIDYNILNTSAELPFTYNNKETIYYSRQVPNYSASSYGTRETSYLVNEDILNMFSANDLRRSIYFIKNSIGNYCIKPINTQVGRPFTGLAVDELFLIKAECLARDNKKSEALGYLNQLLKTRMKTGTFVPIDGIIENVLDLILAERKKALVWRGLRWVDLKRLNIEGANITLTRELNGVVYTLPPNDPRWVFPIPNEEINLR